ncbi:MAG: PA14 domain-containing protein, partial [Armatimonadaceae bacterium]
PSDVHSAPDPAHVAQVLKQPPIATLRTDRLEFAGRFSDKVPVNHFLTVAEGKFTVPPGEYVLEITTDDGCRAWLDGKSILTDAWKYQGPTLYPVRVRLGGSHALRIEHFQIDGYAALRVKLRPAPIPSP